MWGDGGRLLRDSWIFDLNQQQWKKVVFNITRNISSVIYLEWVDSVSMDVPDMPILHYKYSDFVTF